MVHKGPIYEACVENNLAAKAADLDLELHWY